ncbi:MULTISPECIES: methyltransferase [unclassified Azospirillum]|uniref:methyltransferase n=1 Tax=unclassified Azospirillum TaxID=2630922 RepID=UPI000B69286F|nr:MULTISPECIES: methyltransferase [unclassified Azospirillum]SNS95201.1 Methyltransferase small domain-containing protein [Azospirillum sp. RU38E]SNT11621.1 Methyltransferase small domain-containing protein [Azospirillum sp. RU37A]
MSDPIGTAAVVAEFMHLYPGAWAQEGIPDTEIDALIAASRGDLARFRRYLKRRLHGDPLAYILGQISFAGRQFAIDRRAYVTDPETVHLVKTVGDWARLQPAPLRAAEIGVGAGVLAITLLLEVPGLSITGLELDAAVIDLCRENAARHGVGLEVLESDMFAAWGDRPPPDIAYADLPWGDDTTLYGDDRDAGHYHNMPPTSAFPLSGRTGTHQELVRAVQQLGWPTQLWLNCGTLPDSDIADIIGAAGKMRVNVLTAAPNVRLLHLAPSEG